MQHITIQCTVPKESMPRQSQLKKWAKQTLKGKTSNAELTIRIVDVPEMTDLNTRYRHKSGPTNVLSFPFDMPKGIDNEIPILGDIIICADVVNQEAKQQNKSPEAHWAHMVIHGTLHLLGYDHEKDSDAIIMESEETHILHSLGFNNPYDE